MIRRASFQVRIASSVLPAAANRSAEQLIPLLAQMPFFRDVSDYQGLAVPFYKRAQLTAADLSLALNRQSLGQFDDLEGPAHRRNPGG